MMDKYGSTVEAIEAKKKQIEDARKKEEEKIKRAFDLVFNTEAGILLGRYLVQALNYNSVSNETNNSEIIGNTMRRNVYLLKIRPYLNEDVRNKIEV